MISVIIPTLNERGQIERLLETLARATPTPQVIVADGGSEDGTVEAARLRGAVVLRLPRGRGQQLSAGARAARGEILFFLHADTALPEDGLARIDAVLATDPTVIGGNFRLIFDGGTSFDRWLTRSYAWFRRRGFYYGDSGIFLRREVYEAVGGIRAIALMEDYDLSRRMERYGRTCCIDDPPLVTSSRKFTGRRPAAIVLGWLEIHALYHLGVSPDRLARIYYRRS